ncbi:hypothetical protein M406DRAFT_336207 [Cryphonectria parasitica EP155]|uniref:BTB domain-containing protein n=1 Tax=Cryphonectria parasitica (strain ATCC 38755 / EP155) TaxID=660469 RepID=A0A9P4YCM8_CRYP1|nr:uncharacterized protein M406DRAFT_336207 [Cryphonectria parasitica EP155]KAF3770549.1 hypothetical protein M406DRAFT_336207 [Cryphonectria parasitica EP155]
MEPTYEDIIGSKIFKFIVGSRKKEYHVHAAAISPLSKPLNVLLDGPHKEAQELCVEWPDVDEKTFVRFTQWAYTKNYVTEEPDIVLGQHDIPCFDDKSGENNGTECPSSTSAFIPRKNTEGCEDYTGVFMCHAKLYVLGDTYDIPQLRQLSLHRLYVTLREFTLYPSRFNDLATLAQYIFDNTRPDDRIREIIALYYACIVEDALKHDGLQSLLDTTPEFAFGLISNMRERLS